MAEALQYHSGAIVHIKQTKDGYEVDQVKLFSSLPSKPDDSRVDFDFTLGPVDIKGYVDTTKLEVHVEIIVVGITIGTFDFSLKDGLTIKINLVAVSGEIRFYVKNGNELWVHIELKVLFDGQWDEDAKIISW